MIKSLDMMKLLLILLTMVNIFFSVLWANDYNCIKKCKEELRACYASDKSIEECAEIYTACVEICGGGE